MLSAIAARKAAQAAKLDAAPQPPPPASEVILVSESESESDSERLKSVLQNPKRKREIINPGKSSRKKRRKKFTKAEQTQTRYYDNNEYPSRAMEQDEGSSSSSSVSDEDIQEANPGDTELREIVEPAETRKAKTRRAWSPSRLPGNSSGDEVDFSPPQFPFTPDSRARVSQDAGYQTAQWLSFVPRRGENIFYSDDSGIQPFLDRKGTVVILRNGETTALLGVYSLTILRGGVSLMGSELYASASRSHAIFAPRCSPIPIMLGISSSSVSPFSLPDRLTKVADPGDSILFLEDVHTGVEDLGRICKTFDNMFEISSLGEDTLRLSGATLVRNRFFVLVNCYSFLY